MELQEYELLNTTHKIMNDKYTFMSHNLLQTHEKQSIVEHSLLCWIH